MPPYDSRAIANAILDIADSKGKRLTVMQLLKLVYLAHGWWLTFSGGKPLTDSAPQAWQYGPVHPQVYKAFRKYGSAEISGRATDKQTGLAYRAVLPGEVSGLLEAVVESYGAMHAFKLSDIMHRNGTPWDSTVKTLGLYSPISEGLIREHFDGLRRERTGGSLAEVL